MKYTETLVLSFVFKGLAFLKKSWSLKGLWGNGGLHLGGGGGFVYFDLVLWVGADALVSDMIKHQSPCPMGIDVRCLYYTHETPVTPEEPDSILRPLTPRCSRSYVWSVWSIMFFLPKKRMKKDFYLKRWHNQSFGYQHYYKRQWPFYQE